MEIMCSNVMKNNKYYKPAKNEWYCFPNTTHKMWGMYLVAEIPNPLEKRKREKER